MALTQEQSCPPEEPLNKAINYILNRRDELGCFLGGGAVPLDNNICERAIRPVVMGRKAWLFAGSLMTGNRAAQIMSLLETAKRNGLEPHARQTDTLTRLPECPSNRVDELLPWNVAFLQRKDLTDVSGARFTAHFVTNTTQSLLSCNFSVRSFDHQFLPGR